jgi:type II secretory ATPase GspE/PulE/Tfp pilus assembly ATPase PilB-like protein
LLITDATVRRMCVDRVSSGEILAHGLKMGMKTLRQSGFDRAREGVTSIEECLRITKGVTI